ncbi:TSN1-like protein [Mya arenaria]|uniref:Tetraspanin n=1 Tax=Mya arenaria TaxID=6604 RepID=A0ABY7E4T2_MYAAR|nr:TSN1-like protein [Mya arenaria]
MSTDAEHYVVFFWSGEVVACPDKYCVNVQDIDIGQVMINISIGLILGGLVLLGLSFLGCCGACCRFEFILYVYAVIIGVCLIGESVGVGLLYGKPSLVKDEARSSLSIYKGLASDDVYSLAWNIVMIQFQCCGVDSYRDFNVSKSWNRNPVPNDASLTLETPVACCKTLPSGTSQSEFQCALQYSSATSNGDQGCFDSIWKESLGNTAIAVPVLVVLAVIQILFIISAVSVARAEDRVSPI